MHVQPRSKSATAQSGQEPKAGNGCCRHLGIASKKAMHDGPSRPSYMAFGVIGLTVNDVAPLLVALRLRFEEGT